jgi:glycosyltransferase involved in cell wall biosynthesis
MIDSETTWRGGENQLYLLMRGLRAEGVHVELAAPESAAIARRAAELGVASRPLDIRGGMDVAAARRLAGYLTRGSYDIVHCHASHAHSVAFLATLRQRLAATLRLPHRSGPSPPPVPSRPLRQQSASGTARVPYRLVVSRRVDFPFPRHGASALKYRFGADLYLAISNGVRDVLVRCGVDPARIVLVPSGIDLEHVRGPRSGWNREFRSSGTWRRSPRTNRRWTSCARPGSWPTKCPRRVSSSWARAAREPHSKRSAAISA